MTTITQLKRDRNRVFAAAIFILALFCHTAGSAAQPIELTTAWQESFPKYFRFADDPANPTVNGLCVDIIHAIERTVPVKISASSEFIPFKRIQQQLAVDTIDLFVGMARNKSREKKYIFLKTPLYAVHHVIAKRADDDAIIENFDDIRALAPDNIILTNPGTATERFLRSKKGLSIDAGGKNLIANLRKLQKRRGRFIYFHDLGLYGAVRQYGYTGKITILPASFKTYYHFVALAPDTPAETVALLESALQKLSESGELARIAAGYQQL